MLVHELTDVLQQVGAQPHVINKKISSESRPTFISWISPFFREYAERRHETAIGTQSISAVHYTNLETDSSTTRSDLENILDNPNPITGNVVLTQAVGNVQPGSGSYCPTCHGQEEGLDQSLTKVPCLILTNSKVNRLMMLILKLY